MHLSAEDLVDLAEGVLPESSAPHLASCDACRAQLADLRAMMTTAVEAEVPEPSPLFWDQLSRRVHDAVEEEANARLNGSRSFVASVFDARATRLVGSRATRLVGSRATRLVGSRAAGFFGARATGFGARAFQASVAVAALLIIAAAVPRLLAPRQSAIVTSPAAASQAALDATSGPEVADAGGDDVWLTFVADLAAGVDADAVRDAGLDAMNAEEAVMQLSDGELRELERLLQAQIRNQGN
jgi:hypothetical protein